MAACCAKLDLQERASLFLTDGVAEQAKSVLGNVVEKIPFKDAADLQMISNLDLEPGSEGYPKNLEQLVDGVAVTGDATGRKLKFLRRIPFDPMTRGTEWGLRSYQDKPDATKWGGQNVFDVYTTFDGTALDGTKYKDW